MSDITLKKIVSDQTALPLTQTAPKVGKTGEFNKILSKTIEQLHQAQTQAEEAVAKVNAGQLNQLSEVREAIKETNKALHHVLQSRQEIISAYQKIVQGAKKGG